MSSQILHRKLRNFRRPDIHLGSRLVGGGEGIQREREVGMEADGDKYDNSFINVILSQSAFLYNKKKNL